MVNITEEEEYKLWAIISSERLQQAGNLPMVMALKLGTVGEYVYLYDNFYSLYY